MKTSVTNILIVDAEEQFRSSSHFELKSRGYRVTQASSAQKAIEYFPKMPFEAILADAEKPTDGLALVDYLKGQGFQIPIIATYSNRAQDPAAYLARGAAATLRKPFEGDVLAEHLLKVTKAPEEFSYYLNVRRSLTITSWVGILTAPDGSRLRQCAVETVSSRPKFVIMNLHDFRGYDAVLAGEIVAYQQKVTELPAWLILCGLSPDIRERMSAHGLIKEAQLLPTLKDALQFVLDIGMK